MFYTYLWLREDGTPYYVGKGTKGRAYKVHRVGLAPSKERIIIQEFDSEEEAFEAEAFLISYFGREDQNKGSLLNLSDGGEGAGNFSKSTLQKMRRARLGKKPSNPIGKGQRLSPATEIKPGQRFSPSTEFKKGQVSWNKGKVSAKVWLGRKHKPESLEKMRLAKLGKPRAPGTWMIPKPIRHGTSNGYQAVGCRCEACRKWRHDSHLEMKRRKGLP